MSQKDTIQQAAKPTAPSGQDTTPSYAKPAAEPGPGAAQQAVKSAVPTPEELMDKLQTLAKTVLRLASQVNLLSARQEQLEKSLGGRDETKTSEPGGQAKPPEAELPDLH